MAGGSRLDNMQGAGFQLIAEGGEGAGVAGQSPFSKALRKLGRREERAEGLIQSNSHPTGL